MSENTNIRKVLTGKCRLSYAHLFEPWAMEEKQEKKHSACIIIPKSDEATIAKIEVAVKAAIQEGIKSKWKGKKPPDSKLKLPLRDGDEERPEDDAFTDSYFLNANSDLKPGVFDRYKNKIDTSDEVYSGCYCRFSVTFYPFNVNGNVGVACGLNGVQKVANGERLGGRGDVEKDFDDDYDGFEDDDLDDLM
jgi:hypothetical protein